jgi:predicted RNA-binding protein with PIN domain
MSKCKTVEELKEMFERNRQEYIFRKLLDRLVKYYDYTKEDRQEVYDSYKLDPPGVIVALKAQCEHLDNLEQLHRMGDWSHG